MSHQDLIIYLTDHERLAVEIQNANFKASMKPGCSCIDKANLFGCYQFHKLTVYAYI